MKRKAGTILELAGPEWVKNQPEHHQQPAIVFLNKLGDIAHGFNVTVASAFEDRRLTAEGRQEQAAKVTASSLAAIAPLETEAAKLTERASAVEKALRA